MSGNKRLQRERLRTHGGLGKMSDAPVAFDWKRNRLPLLAFLCLLMTPLSASAGWWEDLIGVSVSLETTIEGQPTDEEPGPVLVNGDPVAWSFTITNSGRARLLARPCMSGGFGVAFSLITKRYASWRALPRATECPVKKRALSRMASNRYPPRWWPGGGLLAPGERLRRRILLWGSRLSGSGRDHLAEWRAYRRGTGTFRHGRGRRPVRLPAGEYQPGYY